VKAILLTIIRASGYMIFRRDPRRLAVSRASGYWRGLILAACDTAYVRLLTSKETFS